MELVNAQKDFTLRSLDLATKAEWTTIALRLQCAEEIARTTMRDISPDISPTDYHLFKHFDGFLKEKTFEDKTLIENDFKDFADARNTNFFFCCISC